MNLTSCVLPAQEEGDVEEGGEVGEELEGEHLDGEALLCGSKRASFLWSRWRTSQSSSTRDWKLQDGPGRNRPEEALNPKR